MKLLQRSRSKTSLSSLLTVSRCFSNFCKVNNLRLKLDRAAVALEDLSSKGPLKPEGLRGLDEAGYDEYIKADDLTVKDGLKQMPPKVGVRFVKDDTFYRTGWLLSEEMTKQMLEMSMELKKIVHKSSVD